MEEGFSMFWKSVKREVANLTGLAAWTPCSILILCMLQGAGDRGQAVSLLLAGQSLGSLERLWGASVGYAGSGEPLCLPALLRVLPRPRAAATGAVAPLGASVSWLVSNGLIWSSS